MIKIIYIILLFFISNEIFSNQDSLNIDQKETKSEAIQIDPLRMTKSPSGALWRSIVPGWGQLYNEDYWKVPIMFGSAATLIGMIIHFNSEYSYYGNQLETYLDPNQKIIINKDSEVDNQYYYIRNNRVAQRDITNAKRFRELNQDRRDLAGMYLLAVYLISTIDAYVGAHLYDFSVDSDLGINMIQRFDGGVTINLSYSF